MQKEIVESVLFTDPECAPPTHFCPVCGREVYDDALLCWVCQEEAS